MSGQAQLLSWVLSERPAGQVAVDDGQPRTWAYIRELTRATAARLTTEVSPGDRVGLLLPAGAGWLAAFLAILEVGAVAVPLDRRYPEPEIAALLRDAGARALIREEGQLVVGPPFPRGHPAPRAAPIDAAMLLYTSGTTGRPKGAVLTHANLTNGIRAVVSAWELGKRRALLHALPLHHLHGIAVALLPALAAGMRVVMLPGFDAQNLWERLAEVDTLMAVPTMYHRLLAAHAAADTATRARWTASARALGLATSGSAPLPETVAAGWAALAGAIPLERWGMTEVGVGLANPLDPVRRRRGRVGMPIGDMEVRLDEEGELWVRGPSVFVGYHGRPEETAASFADGWFRTGDIAERDEEGSYRILGRRSIDIIKSGGYKLSALEIEECLREHPAIDDIAVVGLPDEAYGERVAAAVVLRTPLSPEELIAWAKERLAAYKIPREVSFVDALPRNAVGKVEKPRVSKLILSGAS